MGDVFFSGRKRQARPLNLQKFLVPVLRPEHIGVNVRGVYNVGAIEGKEGGVILMPRVTIGPDYPNPPFVSMIYKAFSPDGFVVTGKPEPVCLPTAQFPNGFEDCRITKIDRDYFIVATGYDGKLPHITLFTTRNFQDFNFHGEIGPKGVDDKDAFFHPEKVRVSGQDQLMLYHRVSETGDIQYALAKTVEDFQSEAFWQKEIPRDRQGRMKRQALEKHTLLKHRPGTWENKMGGGPPPLKTPEGWLFFYHASDVDGVYRGGLALLDLKDPRKVIAKSPDPVMEPTLPHETDGPVPNVVFPEGNVLVPDKREPDNPWIYIYYGGADQNVGLARIKMQDTLRFIKQFDGEGNLR